MNVFSTKIKNKMLQKCTSYFLHTTLQFCNITLAFIQGLPAKNTHICISHTQQIHDPTPEHGG